MKCFFPIPLPDNTKTGWSCGEVAVIVALEYLRVLPPLNEKEAEKLTKKIPGYNTWPEQLLRIASVYPMIQAIVYRSRSFMTPPVEHVCKYYPILSAERLLAETDVDDLEIAIRECEKNGQYVVKNVILKTILDEVKSGRAVIVWVCFDTLYKKNANDGFNAHYVIVTGFDSEYVYVHECGSSKRLPEANKPIKRERFVKALGPDPSFMVWYLK